MMRRGKPRIHWCLFVTAARLVAAREDSLATVRARMQASFGVSLEEAEADWLAMLLQSTMESA